MGNKVALQQLKDTVLDPTLADMVDTQLKTMGLTKEQYLALLDEELKKG